MRTVKNQAESDLAKGSNRNSKSFFFFKLSKLKEIGRKELLFSEDGAEFKVVLLPKVGECFTWSFKSEQGIARGKGYHMSAIQQRGLFLSSALLPKGVSARNVEL